MHFSKLSTQSLLAAQANLLRLQSRNRLSRYRPYTKQKVFHEKGATDSERLFMAGNQLGKL